jgi:hypothetical protein
MRLRTSPSSGELVGKLSLTLISLWFKDLDDHD